MKKILLIATLMVTSVFAYTQTEIKRNYELCLNFTGEIDPKNQQITFDDCDKWFELYENMDYYKTGNKDYLVSPIGYYTDLFKRKKKIVTTNAFGERDVKVEKAAKLEFERKTKGQVNDYFIKEAGVYLTDLYNYSTIYLMKDPFYINGLAKKDWFQAKAEGEVEVRILNGYVSSGLLPATFTIATANVTSSSGANTNYGIDTLGFLKRIQKFYTYHKSIDSLMKRDMLFNSFLIWKGYDRSSLKSSDRMVDLMYLYKLSLKKDEEAMHFMDLVATARYDAAVEYLISIPEVKGIYNNIQNKDGIIRKIRFQK